MKNRRWDSDRMGQKALVALLSLSLAAGSSPVRVLAAVSDTESLNAPAVEVAEPADDVADIEECPITLEPAETAGTSTVGEVSAVESITEEFVARESVAEAPAMEELATKEVTSESAVTSMEHEIKEQTASEEVPTAEETAWISVEKKQSLTLLTNHVVVVQTKKNKVAKTALDLDKVSVGEVLWANLLTSDTCRAVTNDTGLSYRWLVADERLEDPKKYTEVVATTRDLTVTEELQGRYVIVEVSDGTTKCYGPSVMTHTDKDEWHLEPLAFPEAKAPAPDEPQQDTSSAALPQVNEVQVSADDVSKPKALVLTTAQTPTDSVDDAWGTKGGNLGTGASAQVATSDPVVLTDVVVVFKGSDALVLSPETGKVTSRKKDVLPATIGDGCSPVLSDNVIYVPLSDGSVVALRVSDAKSATFLTALWVSRPLGQAGTVSCGVSVGQRDGKTVVIVGATQASADAEASGSCTILNTRNGKAVSSTTNKSAGYGKAGALAIDSIAYAGDDAGVVHAFDLATGKELSSLVVSKAPLCGSVVAYGKDLLVMDQAGVLHRLQVLKDGTLSECSSVVVGKGSMSSPVVSGKVAVCATCGPQGKESSTGSLVIVDLNTMQVTKRVTTADGLPLAKGGITAEPLVSVQGDDLWCYFAVDGLTGTVYRYRVGDAHATELYVPLGAKAERASHPLACDSDGNLYYLNASGFVTKLVAAVSHPQGGSDEPGSGNAKPAREDEGQGGKPSEGAGSAAPQSPGARGAEAARLVREQQAAQQDMMARSLAAMQANRISPSEIGRTGGDVDDDGSGPGMPEAFAGSVGPDGRLLASGPEDTPSGGLAEAAAGADDKTSDVPEAEAGEVITVEQGITAALQSTHAATNMGLVAGALALVGLFFYLRRRASSK